MGERYNLLLPNGEKLLWKYNRSSWAFEKDGKDIIAAEFQTTPPNSKFVLKDIDSSNPSAEVIRIVFLDRSKYTARYTNVAAGLTNCGAYGPFSCNRQKAFIDRLEYPGNI